MSTDVLAPPSKRLRTNSATASDIALFAPPHPPERPQRLSKKESLQLSGFATRTREINDTVRDLEYSCVAYFDDYENEGQYMNEIIDEIARWLNKIWNLMSRHSISSPGANLDVVHSCLQFCSRTSERMADCGSTSDFTDASPAVCIKDKGGRIVYDEKWLDITYALVWAWRELLVYCEMEGHPTKGVLDDQERFDIINNVFDILRVPGQEDGENYDGTKFWDKHWTPEMHEASSRLVANRHAALLADFLEEPSLNLYEVLVTPTLRPVLVNAVRKNIFQKWPSITSADALKIFQQNSLSDDIMSMVEQDKLNDEYNRRAAIRYLSAQESTTYREAGLNLLKNTLLDTRPYVWDQLDTVFPDLEDARKWLDEVFDQTETPKELLRAKRMYISKREAKIVDKDEEVRRET